MLGVAALIVDAGPEAVWSTLAHAGVWLPLVLLLEVGFAAMDVVALRLLLGAHARSVPTSVWIRSGLMAYAVMAVLPAGRAGGEIVRASGLAPHLGGARAAAGATVLQGVSLWGNTLISIPCYIVVALVAGPFSPLALLVAGNGLITGALGSLVFFGARISRVGGWLGRHIRAVGANGSRFDAQLKELPAVPITPILASLGGRLLQTLQYGVVLAGVGGALTVTGAFIAQAIHLVGAGVGDMVPNQAGIAEGAYRLFGESLGLDGAQAISIALVHHVCQFALAGACFVVGALWRAPSDRPMAQPLTPASCSAREPA